MWCEIRVAGPLHPASDDWLGALTAQTGAVGETVLTGRLSDQAAVLGVLVRLHAWNLAILSVTLSPGDSIDD